MCYILRTIPLYYGCQCRGNIFNNFLRYNCLTENYKFLSGFPYYQSISLCNKDYSIFQNSFVLVIFLKLQVLSSIL